MADPAVVGDEKNASNTVQPSMTDRTVMTAMDWRKRLFATGAPGWSILARHLVGLAVFLPEGIQKLAFPEILGAGRFANIGRSTVYEALAQRPV